MTHEAARQPVFRLWLRAFAGIVAVLSAAPPAAASGGPETISATERHAWSAFANQTDRIPVSVFLTDAGVYELDASLKAVRAWQRSDKGLELCWPKTAAAAVPMTKDAAQRAGANRFLGKTATGEGVQFKHPVGMDREPDGTRFAVVNAGEWIDKGDNHHCPSVQVYSFEEETGSGGVLSGLSITFENEYKEAFYTVTNGAERVMTGIVDTSYFTTNLLGIFYSTNWVLVISEDPYFEVSSETELPGASMVIATNKWEEEVYHQHFTTNYEWRYTYTTNANYLSTATDVAFLGSEGVLVSITADERRSMPSGFLVFDLSDPSAKGALYPLEELPGAVRKIAVDPLTGDVYASVPDAGAVYRFSSPSSTPESWLDFTQTDDIGVWKQDPISPDTDFLAGVEGVSGSAFGKLSAPADMSVWYPSLGEPVVLVADSANNRIEAFDYQGVPLFAFGGTSAKPFAAPRAVAGDPSSDSFAVAENSGKRVRVFDADLSGVDADSVHSLDMVRPSVQVDLLVEDGTAFFDALHTNAVDSVSILSVESDEGTNMLRFVVPPSRNRRQYSISFEGAAGILEAVSSTTTLEIGETEGFFAFFAKDGVVNEDGTVPVYKATVTSPSGETAESWIAVVNARPTIVTAGVLGEPSSYGFIVNGFSVEASDVDADSALTYLWFATTNFNWGVNNLDWAVTNRDWASSATADWTDLTNLVPRAERVVTNWVDYATENWDDYDGRKHYYTVETNCAAFFAPVASTANGVTEDGIDVWVAKGKDVAVPEIFSFQDVPGRIIEDVVGRMGGIIVLTVIDKDGGATIVRFGTDYDSQDSEWTPGARGGGEHTNSASYEGEFTDITSSYVSYVVRVKSGTSDPNDTVTLKSSDRFQEEDESKWNFVATFYPAKNMKNGSAAGTNSIQSIRASKPVQFFRIFQP